MSKDRSVSSSVFDNRMSMGVGPARLMADVMPYVVWLLPLSIAPPPLHTINKKQIHGVLVRQKNKILHNSSYITLANIFNINSRAELQRSI